FDLIIITDALDEFSLFVNVVALEVKSGRERRRRRSSGIAWRFFMFILVLLERKIHFASLL
ncbi:hypothetical protein J0J29_24025, partial [Vibrio vulnificus]|uniref:hypothetical protein n=1 Tax=Vibrio vulnificus TaxID=672 RepID=UPI0019D42F38